MRDHSNTHGVTSSTTQVDQSTSGEQDDVPVTQKVSIDLGLDVGDGSSVLDQPSDIDFDIEVTDATKINGRYLLVSSSFAKVA